MSVRTGLLALMFAAAFSGASAQPLGPVADCTAPPPARLTWADAQQRLVACNRELVASRRAIESAAADTLVAGQAPNPTFTAGVGSINPKLGIGAGTIGQKTVDTSLRLEQLIERGGKRTLRRQGAATLLAAAREDRREVGRQQRLLLAQTMVESAALDARIALLTEVTTLYEEAGRANARRLSSGDMAAIDAQRQSIDAARASAELLQARSDATRSRQTLAALLAWEPFAASLSVDPSIFDTPRQEVSIDELERRPDLIAARLRVEAARAARDLALAQTTRDVTVGAQVDHFPGSATNPSGNGNTIGFTVAVPLLTHHRFEGEIARARNDLLAAEENRQRMRAIAHADLARLDADVAAARSRLALLDTQQRPLAEQVAQSAERGYTRGALSVLELLDARRVLRQTRLDVLAARAEVARATLARNVALLAGGFSDPP